MKGTIMSITNAIQSLQKFPKNTFFSSCRVITIKKGEQGYTCEIEVVVEDEEMRRFARTPVIGLWAVEMDVRYHVTSFERKGMREATSLEYDFDKE